MNCIFCKSIVDVSMWDEHFCEGIEEYVDSPRSPSPTPSEVLEMTSSPPHQCGSPSPSHHTSSLQCQSSSQAGSSLHFASSLQAISSSQHQSSSQDQSHQFSSAGSSSQYQPPSEHGSSSWRGSTSRYQSPSEHGSSSRRGSTTPTLCESSQARASSEPRYRSWRAPALCESSSEHGSISSSQARASSQPRYPSVAVPFQPRSFVQTRASQHGSLTPTLSEDEEAADPLSYTSSPPTSPIHSLQPQVHA